MIEKQWLAVYTKSRHEKRVSDLFKHFDIEHYLPMFKTLRQWSDRKKMVEMPLFRGYVFVKVGYKEYEKVLQTLGVVCFVKLGNEKVPIPNNQILAIKHYLKEIPAENSLFNFTEGDLVEVQRGPMKGLSGEVIKISGKHKLRIRIDAINQYINLEISASELRRCHHQAAV